MACCHKYLFLECVNQVWIGLRLILRRAACTIFSCSASALAALPFAIPSIDYSRA